MADLLLDGTIRFKPTPQGIQDQRRLQNMRLAGLETERASWVSQWQQISTYILPQSGRYFVQDRDKGKRRFNSILDSTGTRALRILGAGMMGGATSPARPWFRFATPDPDLNKQPEVREWMAEATRVTLDVMQRSNTYRMLHGLYEELGAFGTGASIMTDSFKNIVHHYPQTAGEYYIATDWEGSVNTLYRKFQQRVAQVVQEFGIDNVSQTVRTLFNRGNLDSWVTLVHAIEPRADRDPRIKDARNMAWSSTYWEYGESSDRVLREGGMEEFRALCPRWNVTGRDIYGSTCPGMESLGDIKQLQHEQLRKAEAIDYQVRPPVQAPTAMQEQATRLLPGGVVYSDIPQGVKSIYEVNLNLQYLLADIQDVRQRVNQAFYTDLFLMLSGQQETQMTATEVAERHEEKLLMLGPVIERLHNELFQPLVLMTFERVVSERGPNGESMLPPPPPVLQGADLNVEFISMLAQAQRAVATNSIDRFTMRLGEIAQFKPGVLDKFNADHWADAYSDMLGVDPELIYGDNKVALMRKTRAQAQQRAEQAAQMEQASKAAKNLAQSPTNGGNALSDAIQNYSGYTT